MSELVKKTAAELVELMAKGEASSVEITKAHLERIEALNPTLNSYLHITEESAWRKFPFGEVRLKISA